MLFDKDGTLFDFQASWGAIAEAMLDRLAPGPAARREMALAAGFDPETRTCRAGSVIVAEPTSALASLWAEWRPDLGPVLLERLLNEVSEAAAPETMVTAVPDLAAFLGGLRQRGLVLGVATHDEHEAALRQLTGAGALDAFTFVAGYDSGHGLKPGPGMLEAFAAATAVPAAAVMVVGDSAHDLGMARAGGAGWAIGVLSGPAVREDLAPLADHVLDTIAGLPALIDRANAPG
ncbi:MAG TPA: HAD hydrolase-like protein [Thermohalobaculum sp.]|nr:HAD hydrolase-like protein [Thermohalobaculum sp.]